MYKLIYSLPLRGKEVYYLRMYEEDIVPRIGTFFIVIGAGFILLFIVSDIAKVVDFNYLSAGILVTGIGVVLRKNAKKPSSSGRFESLKKMRSGDLNQEQAEKSAQRKEDNAAKRAQKKEERAAKKANK